VALLEVAEPSSALLRWGHGVYFGKVVPRIGGLLSDRSAYRYLPRSAAYLPPPDELLRRIVTAGFTEPVRRLLGGGAAQLLVATRG
jgi:demethylmenaquinone methyltransferase/2-methoxy-6-polyprenyl-1,4-benzoquinol methylase